jgi:hypothetical protein
MPRRRCGIQRRQVTGAWPRVDQEGDRERQHDQQLESSQQHSYARRQLNSVVGEYPDHSKGDQRNRPPWNMQPEPCPQHVCDQVAKKAGRPRWPHQVIDQVTPCRHKPRMAAQSAGGKGVVAAARRHIPGKLCHRIPDEEANNGSQQERERHIRSRLQGDDWKREHHVGGRSDVGDTLEYQFRKPQRIMSKLRIDRLSRHPVCDLLALRMGRSSIY